MLSGYNQIRSVLEVNTNNNNKKQRLVVLRLLSRTLTASGRTRILYVSSFKWIY